MVQDSESANFQKRHSIYSYYEMLTVLPVLPCISQWFILCIVVCTSSTPYPIPLSHWQPLDCSLYMPPNLIQYNFNFTMDFVTMIFFFHFCFKSLELCFDFLECEGSYQNLRSVCQKKCTF